MTIAIIGPGAVGTTIAAEIKKVLPETQLIGRYDKTMSYFPENTTHRFDIEVTSYDRVKQLFDVIIIAVKTHQLDSVIKQLSTIAHKDSLIILAQNGYGQVERIPYPNVFQAVVYISGQKINRQIKHFRDYQLYIQDNTLTRQFKNEIIGSKLNVTLEPNIEMKIWYKLLVNLGINSITALGHQPTKILQYPHMTELCRHILADGVQVAYSEGIYFNETIIGDIMNIYAGYSNEMGSSMYYDVMNGNPLEIDAIQGYIYRRARYHQLKTPYLDTVYTFLSAYHIKYKHS